MLLTKSMCILHQFSSSGHHYQDLETKVCLDRQSPNAEEWPPLGVWLAQHCLPELLSSLEEAFLRPSCHGQGAADLGKIHMGRPRHEPDERFVLSGTKSKGKQECSDVSPEATDNADSWDAVALPTIRQYAITASYCHLSGAIGGGRGGGGGAHNLESAS